MVKAPRRRARGRVLVRFTVALWREFHGTLLVLVVAMVVGGVVISLTPLKALNGGRLTLGQAMFSAWTALLGQPTLELNEAWWLLVIEALYPFAPPPGERPIVAGERVVLSGPAAAVTALTSPA